MQVLASAATLRRLRRRLPLLAAALLLSSCDSDGAASSPPQLLLRVRAAAEVRARMDGLRIATTVWLGDAWRAHDIAHVDARALVWPVDVAVVPERGKPRREPFEIVVDAMHAGRPLAQARAVARWFDRGVRMLELQLTGCVGAPLGVLCEDDPACHGPSCLACVNGEVCAPTGEIDVDALPPFDASAAPRDAGSDASGEAGRAAASDGGADSGQASSCDLGECRQCQQASDCGQDGPCRSFECTADGRCVQRDAAQGEPLASDEVANDCRRAACDGRGGTKLVADDGDRPLDDGNFCTDSVCRDGVGSHVPSLRDTPCSQGGAAFCDGQGHCATGTLTNVSVTLATALANATGDVTVAFTTAHVWPADGSVRIVFPAGFSLADAKLDSIKGSGVSGTGSLRVSGGEALVTRAQGSTIAAGTAITLVLSAVENPGATSDGGIFAVATRVASGADIDRGTAPGPAIGASCFAADCADHGDCDGDTGLCSCDDGYDGSGTVSCTIKDCGAPPTPNDGSVSTPGGTTYTSVAKYSCNSGYTLIGKTTRTCQANGLWSGSAPSCL